MPRASPADPRTRGHQNRRMAFAPRDDALDVPFQAIIEQALAGIYVLQDERFVYCNETWAAMVGYTAEQLTGMHLRQLVAPDFYETVLQRYYQRLRGEIPSMRFLTRGVHRDGH